MKPLRMLVAAAAMFGTVALLGGGSAQAGTRQADPMTPAACSSSLPGSGVKSHICAYLGHITYDRRFHMFVVSDTDRDVWHTWETREGSNQYVPWVSLGGDGDSPVYLSTFDSGRALKMQVWGIDDRYWCRSYNDPVARGQWTGWYTC